MTRLHVTTDETGNARCPLRHIEWHYIDEDGNDCEGYPVATTCAAELYIVWSFSCPFGPGDVIKPDAVPVWAVAHSWQVECTNGHRIAVSGNHTTTADDAEPAAFSVLLAEEVPA